eukprot:CAMPEP_0198295628 /NCGR_PEP_ID=MMETSP1449-20131203/28761_1 /TAXON_ID=420275 /ORGANISM="Attheya septentrionalis, Strain CCMP2084" /LENGTH=173 /DNA_ID=CAMNT_0043995997 /DNA_START=75 /DNA_END=596 /DNA_ORIENTATION=+
MMKDMNQKQVQMGSCTLKGIDPSLVAPKIWYEDNFNVAIKVAPNDTFDTVASALKTTIQNKSDENVANVTNAALMKAKMDFTTTVTVLGFSIEGTDISMDSDGGQLISSRLAVGDVFQVKVQYDIQFGGGSGASTKTATNGSAMQFVDPTFNSNSTTNTGPIQPGGGSCCVIL